MMNETLHPQPNLFQPESPQDAIPVTGQVEIWCIAHIDAYMGLAQHLDDLHRSIASDHAKGVTSHHSIDERIAGTRHHLDELIRSYWHRYIETSSSSSLHTRHLQASGPPDSIEFDAVRGIPFLAWKSIMSARQSNWRHLVIRIAEDTSGQDFVMVPPFRPTAIQDLPEGTRTLALKQPQHVAMAALREVLHAFLADLQRDQEHISAKNLWVRMRCLLNFYTAVVQERLKEALPEDFHGWEITMPARIPINNAAAVIAKHAANSNMIQTLAIRAIIELLHDCMDSAEEALLPTTEEMVAHVQTRLRGQANKIQANLSAMDASLLSEEGVVLDGYEPLFISKPIPRASPMLALIPKSLVDSVTFLK